MLSFPLAATFLIWSTPQAAEPVLPPLAQANLERNLRWMLERERREAKLPEKERKPARVGVWADAGVWHPGARSIVASLEAEGVPCRVLDRTSLTAEGLKGLESIVLPGGWAPHQWQAAGTDGLAAIATYVDGGGHCLGICAGAYLLSKTVRYDGVAYPYPLGLFDGTAEGPVPDLAKYPEPGSCRLTISKEGNERGFAALEGVELYYSGGPSFEKGSGVTVLATYGKGASAAISKKVGKGEIVLLGAHPERPAKSNDDRDPPPKHAGPFFKSQTTTR